MRKRLMFAAAMLWACCIVCIGCTGSGDGETEVVLETTAGNIRLKLYNDTPGHRDNFINNVENGMYTGVTFHRVIRNFMIQTGDPNTRPEGYEYKLNADGDTLAERIPAEFLFPKYYHRRGVLAAARDGDDENPERGSDKYQFYIITGKNCSEDDMRGFETAREQRDADILFQKKQQEHKDEIDALRAARDRDGLSDLLEKLQDAARYEVSENPPITYTNEQRKAYKVHGGAPWLDGEYTVFGEVVEGMNTVEKIQKVRTNADDKPLAVIKITKAYVVK